MARIYEVPFHPDSGLAWAIRVSGQVIDRCESRFEALRCAVSMASNEGAGTRIDVEGADGVWRPFGTDIKRPVTIANSVRQASAPMAP